MSRSTKVFMLCVVAVAHAALSGGLLRPQLSFAQTASPQDPRTACAADVQKLCSNVPTGGGRIIACLKQHKDEVSDRCKQAIASAMQPSRGGGGSAAGPATTPGSTVSPAPAPVAQPDTDSTVTAPPSPAPQRESHPHPHPHLTAAAGPAERYFLMKQAKIIDQGMGHGKPAYDLMIPTTWEFKGWVSAGVADGGCFADWFSVVGDAKSPDNSIEFQMLPQYTWQYMDDPAGQHQMQMQNQRDAHSGMKPCPVRAPIRAADFLRQDLIAKYRKGKTVVSVDPFPELDQIVRYRLGLPPTAAGGSASGIRTDAARARLAYDDDKGQPVEEWITAAIVVRSVPTGGHGAAYDWHAVMAMFYRAPKGKLDANDRLFKLMASTIRPEPEWQKMSSGVIATLYQTKQQELAKQSQMFWEFQQHVAQTINGVVANSEAGANHAAYGQSQILRGVQTFRDPSSGATFELSNQYDHAWLNGSNQYVMSDDPSFNPNGNLSGNWTALQAVR
ncbi:MAG: cysteine rich repeat-containing protein [Acidobacteriota bacterium]|nr:cysteine rich repeat-containing protein [Acidobacteriota bacterium]